MNNSEYALVLNNVSKCYGSGKCAVKKVDLKVSYGDFFALLGPNGAGKSTILGMILSLIRKTSGYIYVHGYDIEKSYYRVRHYIGFMPQEINLHGFETPMQILVNQAGYFGIKRSKAISYAENLLTDLDLYSKKDTQVRFLSGGMKRRVMVARSLIHKPKVVILDEPTAGVDVEMRHSLWMLMASLNSKGMTVILTTHYLDEAEKNCNQLALLNKGEIHIQSSMKAFLMRTKTETYIFDLIEPIVDYRIKISIGDINIIDSMTIEIKVPKDFSLNQIFIELTKNNIKVSNVKQKTNKLEQAFANITNIPEGK